MSRRDDYNIPDTAGTGASPGFSFGRSGSVRSGAYLSNESVPSNTTGKPIGLSNGRIVGITVSNEKANTFDVELEEHNGTIFTSLGTFSLLNERSKTFLNLDIPVTAGLELAAKISSGSAKNIVVVVYIKGDAI